MTKTSFFTRGPAKMQNPWHHTPRHAHVEVTRFGTRSLDDDNFRGGLKSLLDALKDYRLIADDDAKHMTLIATQKPLVKGDKPCTLVTITAGEKHA